MKRITLCLFITALLAGSASAQCGPWGCPVQRQPALLQPRATTPAWQYVKPVGFRRAVVRIHCWDGGNAWSKGSGVLVRWGSQTVVLTARHVIKDAKNILIDFPSGKRLRNVKVLKVDRTWDCAVLDATDSPPDTEPAAMATGSDINFDDKTLLETCGYGPDGKLAGNRGLFRGYRRSSETPETGPDDWMIVSGQARPGDSGGPVFDAEGRVAGILWGTDGETVVCVQPGRIHRMLNELPSERRPTPPAHGPLKAGGNISEPQPTASTLKPVLPWRKEAEAKVKSHDELLSRLIALEEKRAASEAVGCRREAGVEIAGPTPRNPDTPPTRSPLLGGLCLFAGIIGGFVIYFANQKGE